MAFSTVDDLAIYLLRTSDAGNPFTSAEEDQAALLLDEATSTIQAELRQTIELVEDDAAVLVGNWGSTLVLPELPVVSIASVDIDGSVLAEDSGFTWDGSRTLYRGNWSLLSGSWQPNTAESALLYWGGPSAKVTVTYTHGWDPIPPVVAGVCRAMVARAMPNPGGGVVSETLGAHQVGYGSASLAGTVALMPAERRTLKRWLGQ